MLIIFQRKMFNSFFQLLQSIKWQADPSRQWSCLMELYPHGFSTCWMSSESPSVRVDLPNCLAVCISFCHMYFDILLLGAYTLIIGFLGDVTSLSLCNVPHCP